MPSTGSMKRATGRAGDEGNASWSPVLEQDWCRFRWIEFQRVTNQEDPFRVRGTPHLRTIDQSADERGKSLHCGAGDCLLCSAEPGREPRVPPQALRPEQIIV